MEHFRPYCHHEKELQRESWTLRVEFIGIERANRYEIILEHFVTPNQAQNIESWTIEGWDKEWSGMDPVPL